MSKKSNQDIRQFRAIGHKLKPVVTVAGNGLTDNVVSEVERALEQHELIKIKLAVGGKEAKTAVTEELCDRTGAEVVQSIGNVILVLRRTAQPDPRLSNLLRVI
ncbi:ribosome assembly RNA-binding protein YhbY [Halioglobus maricola]|uniref:Ribosome assembly RNA-binding protein YhbY n=1 Tax=Halioglobus maricola TaxID=2601894 RepID=A0A5P9NG78_9GAMM|nr:ribosome assembly RNA-binding protein YhbY [Halioglobus maricola]QFU74791.1 ribosome assembly RNA-binding protein YhbY [Halioglobus maricola]